MLTSRCAAEPVLTYPTYSTLPPQDQVYHWFSEAGCFVQDPSRPL